MRCFCKWCCSDECCCENCLCGEECLYESCFCEMKTSGLYVGTRCSAVSLKILSLELLELLLSTMQWKLEGELSCSNGLGVFPALSVVPVTLYIERRWTFRQERSGGPALSSPSNVNQVQQ